MAVIDVSPIILNDCTLTVGTDNYEAHVSQVQFDPSTNIVRWKGLTPTSNHAFQSASEWTATLALAQDWETANSLSRYLHDHEGEQVSATFDDGSGTVWTTTLTIAPGSIGGQVDTVAVSTVTMGCTKPAPSV